MSTGCNHGQYTMGLTSNTVKTLRDILGFIEQGDKGTLNTRFLHFSLQRTALSVIL